MKGGERLDAGRLTRRAALGASIAAGGALASGALGVPAAGAADRRAARAAGDSSFEFFPEDARLNAEVLFAIGSAGYGAGEFGEISTAIDRIRAAGTGPAGTYYDAVHTEFRALGSALLDEGRGQSARGLSASARSSFLRAAKYLTLPLFFVGGTSQPDDAAGDYRSMQRAWHLATREFSPPFERVRIPQPGGGALPGYFLRPPGRRIRRPTIILNNGNDAQNVDVYAFGGAAALERGWNALIFEGPGQGALWFLGGVPFRPDWERVMTPVIDYLRGRDDVDRRRIALSGWSQGAELCARAASRDHRIAALILDPGTTDIVDFFRTLWEQTGLLELIEAGERDEANAEWEEIQDEIPAPVAFNIEKTIEPFGGDTFYDRVRNVIPFRITPETARRIEAPTLVTEYELDVPVGPQPRQIFDMLRTEKEFVSFGTSQGAQFHCAPMAPQRRNQVLFDWLEGTLA